MQPSDAERTEQAQYPAQSDAGATREPDRPTSRRDERVLVLAPAGSDVETLSAAATEGGCSVEVARDMTSLCVAIREGAGAVAIVEAGFSLPEVLALREALRAQEPWSDLPLVLISADVEQDEAGRRLLRLLRMLEPHGSAGLLQRPLQDRMLITAFSSALGARRRQYRARALREQLDLERRRGSAVLAALPVGTFVVDAWGRLVEANAAFRRIWGGMPPFVESVEDFRVCKAWPVGANREGPPHEWRLASVLATGQEVIDEELELAAFDGAHRTVLSSAYPIHDARGEIAGCVGVQVDITARARAERARRILSDATAAISESLDPGTTLRTLARIIVTNLADCCAIDEMDERGELRRLVAESSGARSADEAARLLAFAPAGSGNSLAVRVLKSGRPLLVSDVPADWPWKGPVAEEHKAALAEIEACSLMALPLIARGRPLGVLGIIATRSDRRYDARDLALAEEISRRAAIALDNARLHREAEAALRGRDESLSELRAFLDASHVGFAVLDRTLHYRRINDVLAALHGLPAEEHIGRALADVVSKQVEAQVAPQLRRVLTTGEPYVDQAIVKEAPPGGGPRIHFLASFVPLLDVTGMPRAVAEIVTDVTPLTEAKEALRDEADLRERFIGVLAHDLRTPLQCITLSTRAMLRQPDVSATCAKSADRIEHAAARMERMIGNLLDLARGRQGGGIALMLAPADLADVARAVVAEIKVAHPGREIAIAAQGDTHGGLDADRMAQVVSNLVGNAAAYSPAGSAVRVDVAGREGELVLAVHNDGGPIPPRMQKTIFAPFRRGADHAGHGAPSMRGLGLGLFIVGEITRAHGGTIEVTSTAEEGTTFTVRVPRVLTVMAPAA